MKNKQIAMTGMMVALAFLLSYIESLIPFHLGVPGIKLGLSNLVVLFCLYHMSVKNSFGIALVRILLVGITFGNMYSMVYSLAGGLLSFLVMVLMKKSNQFSVYGVSLAGGVSHNIGQILVAMVVLQTGMLIYYLPMLLLAGVVAGLAIGFVGGILIERIPDI